MNFDKMMLEWVKENLRISAEQNNWGNKDVKILLEVFDGEQWLTIDQVFLDIPEPRT